MTGGNRAGKSLAFAAMYNTIGAGGPNGNVDCKCKRLWVLKNPRFKCTQCINGVLPIPFKDLGF